MPPQERSPSEPRPFKARIYLKGGQVIEVLAHEIVCRQNAEADLVEMSWHLATSGKILYLDPREVAAVVTDKEAVPSG